MSAGASGASAFVGFAIPEVALTRLLAEDQAGRRFVREEGTTPDGRLADLFYSMSVTAAGRT